MKIAEQVSLKKLTTLKVGGDARYFCVAETSDDLCEARKLAQKSNFPILIFGGGSNLLIRDDGFAGLVVKIDFRGITFNETEDQVELIAGAGENWDNLVSLSVSKKLSGLENLSGIPGTVGATPVQNVGAYGVEVKDLISWVETFNLETSEIKRFTNRDCCFVYRDSFFKTSIGKKFVITKVSYLLSKKFKPNISYKDLADCFSRQKPENALEIRDAVLKIRAGKFPDLCQIGTAGSFFKNPIISQEKFDELKRKYPDLPGFPIEFSVDSLTINHKLPTIKLSLAWILDRVCHLKGFRDKSVGLFEKQPLVLVNYGDATAEEIKIFSQMVKDKVLTATGIEIEEEVQII